MTNDNAIAIVGMSCRFPGAGNVAQFWENLRSGADTIGRFSRDEAIRAGVDADVARHPSYVPARGTIAGAECFDWAFFGYSPAEAATIDPQQRVFLECCSAALDDAGIDPGRFDGWIGMFGGSDPSVLWFDGKSEDIVRQIIGRDKDYLATRVAYKLGLRGPAITVQTACSTSLVAVHVASQSLLGYECDAALAGGVSVWLPQEAGYRYEEGNILSPDGCCRPFDAAAAGTVPSNGAGVVVLRRLADALSDGDRIVAVIKGSAVNNDGGEKVGFTAPSVAGQRDVIRFALAQADVGPGEVGYVEAHGTGTPVGDPVELAGLSGAFRESAGRCWLGAVKGNIGHTGAASGIAGLIKVACMLSRRELVPTAHFERPNPDLRLEATPFQICSQLRPWPQTAPLMAGVSSFGIGGTNAHAVLECSPDRQRPEPAERGPQIFCLSAASLDALDRMRSALASTLESQNPVLSDAAWTLATGRRQFPYRAAVIAADRRAAVGELRLGATGVQAGATTKVGFLFPGQASLRSAAGACCYRRLPEFRACFDLARELAGEHFGVDLGVLLSPEADREWFADTAHQQLGLFALGYALAQQLRAWGVVPAAMLGNSIGEYVAAALAGVWQFEDALMLVGHRGRLMRETAAGKMLAVGLPVDELPDLLWQDGSAALAVDGPGYVVLSGTAEQIESVRSREWGDGVQVRLLAAEHAFHSPLMGSVAARLHEVLTATAAQPLTLPFISNLTGDWSTAVQAASPDYWTAQLCGTVKLRTGIGTLLASGRCDFFVELGPGTSMSGALLRHPDWDARLRTVPVLGKSPQREQEQLLGAIGRLWERGADIGWAPLFAGLQPIRVGLPPHPLAARTCESSGSPPAPARLADGASGPNAQPTGSADRRDDAGLVCSGWAEISVTGQFDHHVLIVVCGRPDERTRILADQFRGWAAVSLPVAGQAPVDLAQSGPAIGQLGKLAGPSSVIAILAGAFTPALADDFELLAERAAAAGVPILFAGSRLCDVLSDEAVLPDAAALHAWVRHRRRTHASERIRILDVGTGQPPTRPPAARDDTAVYAWRDRRWWALRPERSDIPAPTEVPACAVGGSATGPRYAVVTSGAPDGGELVARLAAAGLRVAASVRADHVQVRRLRPCQVIDEIDDMAAGLDSQRPSLTGRGDLTAPLTAFCAGLVGRFAVQRAGIAPGRYERRALVRRIDPAGRLPGLVNVFLSVLQQQGWLRPIGSDFDVAGNIGALIDAALNARAALGEVSGLCRLLEHCAGAYPAVFSGEREPVSVLYPAGEDELLTGLLADNQIAVTDADLSLEALRRAVRAFRARRGRDPIRVLELGAGQGEFVRRLMEDWPEREGVSYCLTDVSPLVIRRARARCGDLSPAAMSFATFDITRDPIDQGFAAGTFDLIIGYNVVHVAPRIRLALASLRRLLAPGGWLGLVEVTRVPCWTHLIWGLAPGWWDFDDDLRSDSIHLDAAGWLRVLAESGLADAGTVPRSGCLDHALLLAADRDGGDGGVTGVATELRRQAAGKGCDALLYLADLGQIQDPRQAHDSVVRWERLRADVDIGPDHAFVVSSDPAAELGWSGERLRQSLNPVPPGAAAVAAPLWRHIEVGRLGAAEMAAIARVLASAAWPPVARLEPGLAFLNERAAPSGDPMPGDGEATAAVPRGHQGGARPDGLVPALAAIWCEVLGVGEARPADDFFALGGESLMAVSLLTRIRRSLGVKIAMTAFAAAPTFGALAELSARHTAPSAVPAAPAVPGPPAAARDSRLPASGSPVPGIRAAEHGVMVLQPDGAGPPLFLVAPATGTSLGFFGLARLLGGDRPVYGIDSPGLDDGTPPMRRVEDIAAHHVLLVRRMHPSGPYLLGGWSVGAIVAHEMARQLTRLGEDVGLLVCIEGHVPNTRSWPIAFVPRFLIQGTWFLACAALRVGQAGRQVRDAPAAAAVFSSNVRAMLRYRPGPAECGAVVFTTIRRDGARERLRARIAPMYGRLVRVRAIAGDHWTALSQPHLPGLARQLREELTHWAETGGGCPTAGSASGGDVQVTDPA